jgi:hypothetical protein
MTKYDIACISNLVGESDVHRHKVAWKSIFKWIEDRKKKCKWVFDDYTCSYDTSCGAKWGFEDGTAKENGVVFCQSCGKKISY